LRYEPSELVLNSSGQVYHLGLLPENISHKIILVGDQDRVSLVSQFFDEIEHISQHREFICHTGLYNQKRISVISTGIGTDNIDIVINELDALVNIDLINRTDHQNHTSLELVRIGTCGILQKEIPVHSWILSTHSYGLDNVAHFYQIEYTQEENKINTSLNQFLDLPSNIQPYFISANESLVEKLKSESTYQGITVTSSGFYGPQGRQLRLKNQNQDLQLKLGSFRYNELMITNFEMESSALFSLGRALGHQCATICLGVANRPNMEFSKGYKTEMEEMILHVLNQL
jgi:uridine phosphorylase